MTSTLLLLLSLFSVAAADPAPSAGLRTLVYLAGGPGDSNAADKPLRAFFSQWEQSAGLPAGTLAGKYFPQKEQALGFVAEAQPSVFMLPAVTFLEFEKQWGLQAIAQVALGGKTNEVLRIVGKKGGGDLAALKGKTIISNLFSDMKAAELVELDNGTALGKWMTIEYERSPLASMRKVRDGSAAAVLLDESQWAGLEKLPFASELELVAKTKVVPRPVVAVTKAVDKVTAQKLKAGLIAAATSSDAKGSLQQFSVDGIVEPDEVVLAQSRKRLGGAGERAPQPKAPPKPTKSK